MGENEGAKFWKKCSTCKKPIGFGHPYQACSVSSCNHSRRGLQFCSVSCWSGHVPVMRHRDAWAVEKLSPTQEEHEKAASSESPTVVFVTEKAARSENSSSGPTPRASELPKDVLVVASKLKAYIRAKSEMNTSADVMDVLSEQLRRLCDDAIERARVAGRKTVMGRDF